MLDRFVLRAAAQLKGHLERYLMRGAIYGGCLPEVAPLLCL